MAWLTQNWLWIAGAVAVFFLMSRMGGCGMGGRRRSAERGNSSDDRPLATSDSGSRGIFDPVNGRSLVASGAPISSVYHNRAYFFESPENRTEFEAHPEKYTGSSSDRGIPVETSPSDHRQHHHHGC